MITFRCDPELYGVIPAPAPSTAMLPEWFRKLPPIDAEMHNVENPGLTIKRCMPFLDALTIGHILLSPADISVEINDKGVKTSSRFPRPLVESHKSYQIKGAPESTRAALKLLSLWTVTTPPGWSTLFIPLLNRPNDLVDVLSGVVDTDTYRLPVNIVFFVKPKDGLFTIPKGYPICQMIPFRRSGDKTVIRASTPDEIKQSAKQSLNIYSMLGWYRKIIWSKR
jgi:hypothetical protein